MIWKEPRTVDEFVWLDCEIRKGGTIFRVGRVSWARENPDLYDVSITYEAERGLGLYCWPKFRVLSEAQAFIESLMQMPSSEAMQIHGKEWPNGIR